MIYPTGLICGTFLGSYTEAVDEESGTWMDVEQSVKYLNYNSYFLPTSMD
jgi:hypothetical protein